MANNEFNSTFSGFFIIGGYPPDIGKMAEFYNPLTKVMIFISVTRLLSKIFSRNPVLLKTSLWKQIRTQPAALCFVEGILAIK